MKNPSNSLRTLSLALTTALLAAALLLFAASAHAAAPTHPYLPSLTQGGFTEPCGAAVDSHGDLYVADYEADAIKVFGPAGEALTEFTPEEKICSLAVDSTGAIYAAGFETKATKYVPAGGQYPPTASTSYEVDAAAGTGGVLTEARVTSLAVDPSDDGVYVVEERAKVGVYDSAGTRLETIAEGLVPAAEYIGVEVYGANGDVYITDSVHGKVYVLNPAGTQILAETDGSGSPEGAFTEFNFPYLAVDQSNGNFLVSDIPGHHVVDEFDPAGTFVSQIGPEAGGETIEDAAPSAIAVDNGSSSPNQGDVYVTSLTGKVYAFGPLPAPTHPYLPALTQGGFVEPCGAAVDSHGDLYVADYEADAIKVFGPAGEALTEFTPEEKICSLAVDSTGAIYAAGFETKATKYVPVGGQYPPTASTGYEVDTSAGTDGVLTEGRVTSLAVDPSDDDVYVVEERAKVGIYDSAGAELETIAEGLVPGAEYIGVEVYGADRDVYLTDSVHGKVYVLNPAGTQILAETDGSGSPEGAFTEFNFPYLAVDQSNGNFLVSDIPGHHVVDEFDPAGTFVSQIGPEAGGETIEDAAPSAIAVDNGSSSPNQGDVYVTSLTGKVYAFGPLSYEEPTAEDPTAETGEATEVGRTSVLLHGIVNPKGSATTNCRFEWGPASGEYTTGSAPCEPDPGAGNGEVAVSAEATGLTEGVVYHFQVVIETGGGSANGGDESLKTVTNSLPVITAETARIGQTEGTLEARIVPSGSPTTYHFEYLTESIYLRDIEELGSGHGFDQAAVTTESSSIGADFTEHNVSAGISGLEAGATYRYRAVATNSSGTEIGPDQGFTTLDAFGLADGRGYELVSPPEKGPTAYVKDPDNTQFPEYLPAEDGQSAFYPLSAGMPGSTAGGPLRYIARRTPSAWQSVQVTPPQSATNLTAGSGSSAGRFVYVSESLSCRILLSNQMLTQDAPSNVIRAGGFNLYRQNADGSYTLLTDVSPRNPGAVAAGSALSAFTVVGASEDCSRVVFESPYEYEGLSAGGLYDWNRGTLENLAVRPDGTVPPRSSTRAGGEGSTVNAVSRDASRIFFSSLSNSGGDNNNVALYLRQDGETTKVSTSEGSAPDEGAAFQTASIDGSRVLFLANYGVAPSASTGPTRVDCSVLVSPQRPVQHCDLYEYDVGTGQLVDLSVDRRDPLGATVAGVLGASADATWVYFAAQGKLKPGEGRTYVENGAEESYNVYLSHDGQLSYVGMVDQTEVASGSRVPGVLQNRAVAAAPNTSSWTSQVTPDGGDLLFISRANVTGYESGGAAEAYLYSNSSGSAICLSCRPDGAQSIEDMEAQVAPLAIGASVSRVDPPRAISDDGNRAFFTIADPLAPGAVAGNQNLYEWHAGQISLLATGPLEEGFGAEAGAIFVGASANGTDAFFTTSNALIPQDTDSSIDLYDARIDGGFASPEPPSAGCDALGEGACQQPSSGTSTGTAPATGTFTGPGNRAVPPHHCRKGKVRRRGKCVRKPHATHRRHARHQHARHHKDKRHRNKRHRKPERANIDRRADR